MTASIAALAGAFFIAQPAKARGPIGGPLCGPTYQWSCSKVGGPSRLFIGTVCDKNAFEAKTGLTCTAF